MKIIYEPAAFTGHAAVVALGMFDGVHIGHQALIRRAVALAGELDAQSVVCTFDRHPLSVLCPEKAPAPLLPLHENLKKFERLGAEWALVQAFTPEYGATPPEAFLRTLVRDMRVVAIVTGGELHLRRGRQGRRGADPRHGGRAGLSRRDRAPGDGRRRDVLLHPDSPAVGKGRDGARPEIAQNTVTDILSGLIRAV